MAWPQNLTARNDGRRRDCRRLGEPVHLARVDEAQRSLKRHVEHDGGAGPEQLRIPFNRRLECGGHFAAIAAYAICSVIRAGD